MIAHHTFRPGLAALLGVALLLPAGLARTALADDDDGEGGHGDDPCSRVALALRRASTYEARDEYWVGVANCIDQEDPGEVRACLREQAEALDEALALVAEQFRARRELCELLGGGPYAPSIDPEDFVEDVTNPFFPLVPGTTKVFLSDTDEGLERIETTVTYQREEVLGVSCVVVHDVAFLDGEVIEDTLDYYAQDVHGTVWYFGELSMSFEDGRLASLDGSWRSGEDGARPGIIMEAAPAPGDAYRQELLANEAEDAATVTGLGRHVVVPYGAFDGCLETLDFTPIEPDLMEAKFYAPSVGVVLEVDPESGERTELVAVY
jgi:hypothetical protein